MKTWMSLTTYMNLVSHVHELQHQLRKPFDFDTGVWWQLHVKSNYIAMKTADIVLHDRHHLKINA